MLNLAAGLGTRPHRRRLPADIRWVEADLPGIVDLKTVELAEERPSCVLERVALDVSDVQARRDLLARLQGSAHPALVAAERLLVYLEADVVTSLAGDLRRYLPCSTWLLENISPEILARQRRLWARHLAAARAEHEFAPPEGLDFFRPHGWVPRSTRSLLDEAHRLGREMPMAWLMRLASWLAPRRHARFRRAVSYAIMEPMAS